MDFTFAIQNPNSKPKPNQAVIYQTEKNTLNFVFTNNAGAPTLQNSDTITLIIPSDLLDSASAANLGSTDWEVQSFSPADGKYTFILNPQNQVAWDENNQITIALINLEGGTGTNDNVSADYYIGGSSISGSSVKLAVLAPPDQLGDLLEDFTFSVDINLGISDSIQPGQIYISPVDRQNQVAVPISNTIHVNLKYKPNSGSVIQTDPGKTPKFTFSFATGTSDIDLTDDINVGTSGYNELTSAWSIISNLGSNENGQWKAPYNNPAQISPSWDISPQTTTLFDPLNPNLDVIFTHVISILPEGSAGATVYIQWSNIPGYNGGITALDLPKKAVKPKIVSFTGPTDDNNPPEFGSKITLNWETFGVASLGLSWDLGYRTIKDLQAFDPNNPQLTYTGSINTQDNADFILDSLETELTLTAYDKCGNLIDTFEPEPNIKFKDTTFPSPTIDEFSGNLILDGNNNPTGISFSGLVSNLGNLGVLSIDGVQFSDPGQYNGFPFTKTIPPDALIPLDHTLEANQNNGNANETASETITLPTPANLTPIITSFTAAINPDGINVILTWQVQNAVYSGNNPARSSSCEINGTNYGLDSNGHGSATLPISFDGYNLKASNPGAGSAQKTLMPSFSWGAPSSLWDVEVDDVPSFAVLNGKLYCAFTTDSPQNDTLHLIEYDGQNWLEPEQQTNKDLLSHADPSLGVFNDTLFCLKGPESGDGADPQFAIGTTDGVNWVLGNQININQIIVDGGVFAAFGNYLYFAFTNEDDNTLLINRMDAQGNWTPSPLPGITDNNQFSFHTLVVFNNSLYCAYSDTTHNLLLSSSADGASWNSVPNPNLTSNAGFALAAFGNGLYCVYGGDGNLVMSQMDKNGKWTYIGQVSNDGDLEVYVPPTLAVFNQKLYCAYMLKNRRMQIMEYSIKAYPPTTNFPTS